MSYLGGWGTLALRLEHDIGRALLLGQRSCHLRKYPWEIAAWENTYVGGIGEYLAYIFIIYIYIK